MFFTNLRLALIVYIVLFIITPSISEFYGEPRLIEISRIIFISILINALCMVPYVKLDVDLKFKTKSIINVSALTLSSFIWLLTITVFGLSFIEV